ncbi:MAG: hypothetical protein HY075_06345 [Deltaproteobacteria bacterium]|nr:hypothetical protein [Deltaproteobacteria bacterium]
MEARHRRTAARPLELGALVAALALALSAAACGGGDPYAEAAPACSYVSSGTAIWKPDGLPDGTPPTAWQGSSSLKPECKAVLEKLLPFDGSWTDAPDGLKDRVMEAFQALLAYPLALPNENRIFGVAPWSYPLGFIVEIQRDETPMKSLFNHALSVVDTLHRVPSLGQKSAQWTPDDYVLLWNGVLTIADSFADLGQNPFFTTPIQRASILVHEAHHGDGYFHHPCGDERGWECDFDLNGPFGYAALYDVMALHGSASFLSDDDIRFLFAQACSKLKTRFNHLPPDLQATVDAISGCWDFSADDIAALEGLKR